MLNGLLIVDKQKGWTSNDVVAFLRRTLKLKKVGHAGTLDPLATGVLVLAVGRAVRTLDFLTADDKEYETTVYLGKTSTTHDAEGELTEVSANIPAYEDIENVLHDYRGTITQVPPIYSAIRVGGIRAYDLARDGQHVEIPARQVEIKKLEIISYTYPHLALRVMCSKGTYIRTLGSDIGASLGVGGYLSDLRRTRSGSFDVASAYMLTNMTTKDEVVEAMIPLKDIPLPLPTLVLTDMEAEEVLHGRKIPNNDRIKEGELFSLLSMEQSLLAIATVRLGQICVYKNFM